MCVCAEIIVLDCTQDVLMFATVSQHYIHPVGVFKSHVWFVTSNIAK